MNYRLKVSVEKITFPQWLEIFETLRTYGDFGYKILKNDEGPLEDWYGTSILPLMYLISTSPHYDIDDEYVLEDGFNKVLISGDEKSILEALSPKFKEAISCYKDHLENFDFGLPNRLESIFEIDAREY